MEAINPFADPEFKKQILAKEKKNADSNLYYNYWHTQIIMLN